MNYNATPVENLPAMPPQSNDPMLMSQVMQDAHMDSQRPNIQVPHVNPSYYPSPPVAMVQSADTNSFIPDLDINAIVEKFKEPLMVSVLVFILHTDVAQDILKQNIPTIFTGDDVLKQILVKAVITGAAFFILKQSINK